MEKIKRLSIASIALWLVGCASFTPKPLDPGTQHLAFESRSLSSSALQRFFERTLGHAVTPWPPRIWDLTSLTLAAYYFQPTLDVTHAHRLLAQAGIITAGGRPNPRLSTPLDYNTDAPRGISPWHNGLGITVPVETAGKRDYRLQRAEYLAQAAKLREIDALWQVRSHVRFDLLKAYSTVALVQRQRDLQQEIVQVLEHRLTVGFTSALKVTRARIQLDQATLALQQDQMQQAQNIARIAAAIGVPTAVVQRTVISFAAFERLPPRAELPSAEMRRQALLHRPDVLAALATYAASQSALQLEMAKQYPNIVLGPGYLWDAGEGNWTLGLALMLPLLNHNQGPIAEAEARRKEAGAVLLAIQAKAIAAVAGAVAGYDHALRLTNTAAALLHHRQKREHAVYAALEVGETDRLALLKAQYETITAQLAQVKTRLQAQRLLGHLEDALRTPLSHRAGVPTAALANSMQPSR